MELCEQKQVEDAVAAFTGFAKENEEPTWFPYQQSSEDVKRFPHSIYK